MIYQWFRQEIKMKFWNLKTNFLKIIKRMKGSLRYHDAKVIAQLIKIKSSLRILRSRKFIESIRLTWTYLRALLKRV